MSAAQALGRRVGRKAACRALNLPRASFYRHLRPNPIPSAPRPKPSRALEDAERQAVMDTLHSERFRDQAPSQVYATLLDECTYLCSIRTMYRYPLSFGFRSRSPSLGDRQLEPTTPKPLKLLHPASKAPSSQTEN